jgi:hypothetical protein
MLSNSILVNVDRLAVLFECVKRLELAFKQFPTHEIVKYEVDIQTPRTRKWKIKKAIKRFNHSNGATLYISAYYS